MSYSTAILTFKEPTKEELRLTKELSATIHDLHRRGRESLFHLCVIAYGLRKHNLQKLRTAARGGNAKQERYKPQFTTWYTQARVEEVYGSLSNFTLYAMAGRLLNYVRWQLDEKYIDRMPSTLTALYELSKIISNQGGQVTRQGKDVLLKMLRTTRKDGTGAAHLIHPQVTRSDIQNAIGKVRGTNARSHNERNGLLVCSIYVGDSLLAYTKSTRTKKRGTVNIEDVKILESAIQECLKNIAPQDFWMDSHVAHLSKQIHEKTNFGKHL